MAKKKNTSSPSSASGSKNAKKPQAIEKAKVSASSEASQPSSKTSKSPKSAKLVNTNTPVATSSKSQSKVKNNVAVEKKTPKPSAKETKKPAADKKEPALKKAAPATKEAASKKEAAPAKKAATAKKVSAPAKKEAAEVKATKPAKKEAAPKTPAKKETPAKKVAAKKAVEETPVAAVKEAPAKKTSTAKKETAVKKEVAAPAPKEVKAAAKPAPQESVNEIVIKQAYNPANLPPFVKMQQSRLHELRSSLMDTMDGVVKEVLSSRPEGSDGSVGGMHMGDAGSDAYDRDFALSMLSKEQDALYEINEALIRIDHGVYGVCEMSGLAINEERLEALPYTRYTREMQEIIEKEQLGGKFKRPIVRSVFGLDEDGEDEDDDDDEGSTPSSGSNSDSSLDFGKD